MAHLYCEHRRRDGDRGSGRHSAGEDHQGAIDPAVGFQGYNGRNIAFGLGLQHMEPAVMNPFHSDAGESLSALYGEELRHGGDQPACHHQRKET